MTKKQRVRNGAKQGQTMEDPEPCCCCRAARDGVVAVVQLPKVTKFVATEQNFYFDELDVIAFGVDRFGSITAFFSPDGFSLCFAGDSEALSYFTSEPSLDADMFGKGVAVAKAENAALGSTPTDRAKRRISCNEAFLRHAAKWTRRLSRQGRKSPRGWWAKMTPSQRQEHVNMGLSGLVEWARSEE